MNFISDEDHKAFVLWAANCAEHILCVFEENSPLDNRPREAIATARLWVDGKISLFQVRKFAFAAHAAARDTTNPKAIAAARAAGHAAATVHVYTHAKYAAQYATKSAKDADAESKWQTQNLPENLRKLLQFTP